MFYVYEHWRPDRDEPFYVGKGRGGRANMMARRNLHHKAIQQKLHRLGMCVEVRIILAGLSEQEAFALEVERIAMWRAEGIDLANKSDGGEGSSGHIGLRGPASPNYGKPSPMRGQRMKEEHRKKLSAAMKGKKNRLGAKLSDETKKKIATSRSGQSSWAKGRAKPIEVRQKISQSVSQSIRGENNPFYGKNHSEETKRKISETKKMRAKNAS